MFMNAVLLDLRNIKNIRNIKKMMCKILLSVSLTASMTAVQAASTSPPSVAPKAPTIPSPSSWPYSSPAQGTSAIATIDKSGVYYLPYLPWLGQNLSMLVNYSDFFYQLQLHSVDGSTAPFNVSDTTTANNLLMQTESANMNAAGVKTEQGIAQYLTFTPNSTNLTALAFLPGTDIGTPCLEAQCPSNPPAPDNAAFNADTLFGVTGYAVDKNGQNQDINHLIAFLSNLTSTFQDPGFSTDAKTMAQQLNVPQVKSYILAVRTAAAMQSMALSNFNYLAQERQIIAGLGKSANMNQPSAKPGSAATPVSDASQLQIDKYLIDRRLNNPAWYAQMNTASSIAIQRETLFVLMEMQRQLFEMRMLNERILSTLSLAQTGIGQTNSQLLLYRLYQAQSALKPPATQSGSSP